MSVKSTKKTKASVLKIGSDLSIDFISEIQSKVNKALKQKKSIKISSELIENIDLSGIQFLLHITMLKQFKSSIEFDLSFSEGAKDMLSKCGFSDYLLA